MFVAALTLPSTTAIAGTLPWEIWTSPDVIARLDPADQVLERSSYCLDGCRYDHANLTWEGIAANPYPYRWLFTDGDEEVVFDDEGPGAITRIWMTEGVCIDPATGVRIYVDGTAVPIVDMALSALFDGSTPPFTPPLAYARVQASGGYVSYVPIAYAQHLRIALTNADNGYNSCTGDDYRALWFQFQYHHLPLGSALASFTGQTDAPALRSLLAHGGDDPWVGGLAPSTVDASLSPSSALSLGVRNASSGWLRGVRLQLARGAYARVNLRLQFDGTTTVDMPLQDFFTIGAGPVGAAQGVLVGEDAGGALYAWFPMPFRQAASVALQANATLGPVISVHAALYWDDSAVPDVAGTFAAQLHDYCPNTPGQDFVLYAARGAGRVVGVSATYQSYGIVGRDYLEGDERAYRDGAIAPAWYGTGVEDFYNGGFYFVLGPYSRALSGATAIDLDGTDMTSAYRLMLTDYLDYGSSLELRQEAGPAGLGQMCARSVAYAYAALQPQLVSYARIDLADQNSVARHAYQVPPIASCTLLDASYSDEPPTEQNARVCSYTFGSSTFTFALQAAAAPLRLRRTFDAAQPGQVAEIWVNGALAGRFPYTQANPARRWQQQEALLNTDVASSTTFQFEIRPRFAVPDGATVFTESAYELLGGFVDPIFRGDFELEPNAPSKQAPGL
jgi:hypothetical protein